MSAVMQINNKRAKLVFTGENAYQLFWKDRGYIIRSGEFTPELPMHECQRLLKTGFFAANAEIWHNLMFNERRSDPTEIEGILSGQRCFLLGGGPSLKGFDLSRLDNEFTIAVNHSWDFYPKAKALVFVAAAYAKLAKDRRKDYKGMIFASFRCREILKPQPNLYIFPQNNTHPGRTVGEGLFSGRLSGLVAINVALIMNADEIYLMGYDMNYQNGDHHWYGQVNENQAAYEEANFTRKIKLFDVYAPYADRIFNCSKDSALYQFKKVGIEDVLGRKGIVRKPTTPRVTQSSLLKERVNREMRSSCPTYPTSTLDKLAKVNGMLAGKRVFVIGSGPSLKDFDLSRLNGEETIAVNHTIEHYRDCKYHLFGDPRVYDYVKDIYKDFKGMIFASHHANLEEIERKDSRMVVFAKNWNRVTDCIEDGLYSDFNSGMEAVNLALVMGAKEIYLMGIDFCANEGEYYFYGRPKWFTQATEKVDKLLDSRVKFWDKFAAYRGRIFNCSKISRVKQFEYRDIEEVLGVKAN
jgi:uncharacterized Rossmann fold enzyme